MTMRMNHMELTYPEGSLTDALKKEIGDFYGELFGWTSMEVDVVGQKALLLMLDDEVSQFILLAESPHPIQSPGYDHLGLLLDTREEVDALLAKCRAHQAGDGRIEIKEYQDLKQPGVTVHAFYVRHLLPIWFDVQCMEYEPGMEPARQWRFG